MFEKIPPEVPLTPEALKYVNAQCLDDCLSANVYLLNPLLQNGYRESIDIEKRKDNNDKGEKESRHIGESKSADLSIDKTTINKKSCDDDISIILYYLLDNPLLGQTAKELSDITGIDLEKVNAVLEMVSNDGMIHSRKRDNELEYWKPAKASNEAEQVYNVISTDSNNAETIEEIAEKIPGLSKSAVRATLYWLLKEGRVTRQKREKPENRRKNSWEYWKDETLSQPPLENRDLDLDFLLNNIPERGGGKPITARELAITLNKPYSSIRSALRRLEIKGYIRREHKSGRPPAKCRYTRIK